MRSFIFQTLDQRILFTLSHGFGVEHDITKLNKKSDSSIHKYNIFETIEAEDSFVLIWTFHVANKIFWDEGLNMELLFHQLHVWMHSIVKRNVSQSRVIRYLRVWASNTTISKGQIEKGLVLSSAGNTIFFTQWFFSFLKTIIETKEIAPYRISIQNNLSRSSSAKTSSKRSTARHSFFENCSSPRDLDVHEYVQRASSAEFQEFQSSSYAVTVDENSGGVRMSAFIQPIAVNSCDSECKICNIEFDLDSITTVLPCNNKFLHWKQHKRAAKVG